MPRMSAEKLARVSLHSDVETEDQGERWCPMAPRAGVWRAGGTGARVTAPLWKRGAGPAGSVAITNACAGSGRAAISASPAGAWGGGAWSPVLASEAAMGKAETISSHSRELRPAESKAQAESWPNALKWCDPCCPPPTTRLPGRICVRLPPPVALVPPRFEFCFCKGNDLRSRQGLHPGPSPHSSRVHPRATLLSEAPQQACSPLEPGSRCSLGA